MSRTGAIVDAASKRPMDVTYFVNDKLGGVASFYANLLGNRAPDSVRQTLVLVRKQSDEDARISHPIPADDTRVVEHRLPGENLYAVLRRARRAIPPGPGAVVCNDWLELATLAAYPCERTVYFVVHDDYYVSLAERHAELIDVFVTHSRFFRDRLAAAIPAHADRIAYLPYGINLAPRVRRPTGGPLRLLFIGRLTESKGVLDLPMIDEALLGRGCAAAWTVTGDGPLSSRIREVWKAGDRVRFVAPKTNAEVLALCGDHDVFVLPTRFEGFPVSLVEAMSGGLVPVISDIPSGIPEVVGPETGFLVPVGDCEKFADAIAELNQNRDRLEHMSAACRSLIESRHDIRGRSKAYHALFGRTDVPCRQRANRFEVGYGSRLDKRWLPNWVVRGVRSCGDRVRQVTNG